MSRCPSPVAIEPLSSTMKNRSGNVAILFPTAVINPGGKPLDDKNRFMDSLSIAGLCGGRGGIPPANCGGGSPLGSNIGRACAIGGGCMFQKALL